MVWRCGWRRFPGIGVFDTTGDLEGNVEGVGALMAGDLGFVAGAGTLDKGLKFDLERLALGDGDRLSHDSMTAKIRDNGGIGSQSDQFSQDGAFPFIFAGEAQKVAGLVLIIEREVSVFLEDANLSHFVFADPAGGDIGNAAIFKLQSDIGDVLALAEDRYSHSVHADNGRTDKVEDDLKVVNHEIKNNADVRAPVRVG